MGTIIAATVGYESAMAARRGTATYAFDQSLLVSEGAEALADGRADVSGKIGQERIQARHVLFQVGWQLEQQGSELGAEGGRRP